MNREIKTKKVGRQKKLTNPCPSNQGRDRSNGGKPKMYYLPMV